MARPSGPREARPKDKLHVRAIHLLALTWIARMNRAMT
jgi:hypothetical protein